jgi:hypothetical protein
VYTAINSVADPNSAVLLELKQFLYHFLPVISKVDYLKNANFFTSFLKKYENMSYLTLNCEYTLFNFEKLKKNKIEKMKTIKMVLLAFVLLATACSQNTTTPTTPPATTGYNIDSTYYFKINFNGQTLSHYSVFGRDISGSGIISYPNFSSLFPTQIKATSSPFANTYIQSTNVGFGFTVNRVGDTVNSPVGAYDFHAITLIGGGYGSITDLNTSKSYTMDSASTLLNVTNTSVSGFTGVMSGKLNDGTTLIPFTASFCLKKLF